MCPFTSAVQSKLFALYHANERTHPETRMPSSASVLQLSKCFLPLKKLRLKIAQSAVVCVESKLRGVITIGSMTVVHPRATIIAESGPIVIGENNIIEEQACIAHRLNEGEEWDANRILYIGVNNVFEVGCTVYADKIGDHNVFEAKCSVGPGIEVTNGCIIGAGCELTVPEKLRENSVICGSQCALSIATDKPPAQTLQLEFLSKVLPNYHHLKKTSKKHDNLPLPT